MKKLFVCAILISGFLWLTAAEPSFLIRMDKQAVAQRLHLTGEDALLMKAVSPGLKLYYLDEQYLLAGTQADILKQYPHSLYDILEPLPLQEQLYLVSGLPTSQPVIPSAAGEVLCQLSHGLLLKSALNNFELAKLLTHPFTRLQLTPLQPNNAPPLPLHNQWRTDFGNLLTSVNADSITWFIQHLQDFGTRNALAGNRLAVAQWIKGQFQRLGITTAYIDSFYVQTYIEYNVVACLPGTVHPDKYIVVGGHHDSIVMDGNDPLIFAPGADDNASGATAALEMARVMHANNYQPECSIVFVTFACEEYGLWGSKDFAQKAQNSGMDIKLMINHDMIAHSTQPPADWQVMMMPYGGCENYTAHAMDVIDAQTILTPYAGSLNSAGSDSYSFWQKGFPCIYFFEDQFCPYYHSVNDLVANINPAYCQEVIKASVAVAATFDQMPTDVTGLTVRDAGNGTSLLVNWTASQEVDVVNYKVYWTPDLQTTPLQATVSTNAYTINGLTPGQNYYVIVTAVDGTGSESMGVYQTGVPLSIPRMPLGFTDNPAFGMVHFIWQANQEGDIAGYRIYRSLAHGGPFSLVGTVTPNTLQWTDTGLADLIYYYYYLKAYDTDGNESDPTDIIKTRNITMDQGILVVDETRNNTSNTVFAPSDLACDAFYADVMRGFQTAQLDTETDGYLRLADIGIYSSILWHGNDYASLSYPYEVRDALRQYVDLGGNLLVSSYLPTQAFDQNHTYPCAINPQNYMYQVFGVGNVWYYNNGRLRYAHANQPGFPALEVDSLKTLASLNGHIFQIEAIGAAPDAQDIYLCGTDYADSVNYGVLNDFPVGVYKQHNPGRTILLSFPLYNMKSQQVRNLMTYAFAQLFGETPVSDDAADSPMAGILIQSLYPNPCSDLLHCKILINDTQKPLQAAIYNLKGQKVRTLFSGLPLAKAQSLIWNGTNDRNQAVAKGIYLLKVSQGHKVSDTRKLLLYK